MTVEERLDMQAWLLNFYVSQIMTQRCGNDFILDNPIVRHSFESLYDVVKKWEVGK